MVNQDIKDKGAQLLGASMELFGRTWWLLGKEEQDSKRQEGKLLCEFE